VAAESEPQRTGREANELRPITLEREVAPYAEGSCLVSFGTTRVLCTASVEEGVPNWRRAQRALARRASDRSLEAALRRFNV
jgi:ribonuclease PH